MLLFNTVATNNRQKTLDKMYDMLNTEYKKKKQIRSTMFIAYETKEKKFGMHSISIGSSVTG